MKYPLAYIFMHTDVADKYDVITIYRNQAPGKGCAIAGIIWIRQPTEQERICAMACISPGGFELIAKNYDNNT